MLIPVHKQTESQSEVSVGSGIRDNSFYGPLANDVISYSYDVLGRVTSRAINGVAVNVSYDALGRVTTVTNVLGGFTNSYVNATERLSVTSYPNGQSRSFSYDGVTNDLRLQTIWHKNATNGTISKFDYTYDAEGQIQTWTQQADTQTPEVHALEYDRADQLLGVTVQDSLTQAILKQYGYAYDAAGNRTSEQINLGVRSATHNNLNQLVARAGGGPIRLSGRLNELGTVTVGGQPAVMDTRTTNFVGYADTLTGTNVVDVLATDYSANARTNRYQVVVTNSAVTEAFGYDLNGNLASVISSTATNTYEWDAENRLVAVNIGTNRSEFTYDGLGRRVRIVERSNGVVQSDQRYLWVGTELSEERNAAGDSVTRQFFAEGERVAGTNLFFATDHLGSIREMTDGSGTVRARYAYDPYGRRTKVSGDLEADFGFTGHYYAAASGLHLALFRGYHADLGRWLNRDPIEEDGGLNLFAYAHNSPIRSNDLSGLCPTWEDVNSAEVAAKNARNAYLAMLAAKAFLENAISRLPPPDQIGGSKGPSTLYDLTSASRRLDLINRLNHFRALLPSAAEAAQGASIRAVKLRAAYVAGELGLASRAGLIGLAGAGGYAAGRALGRSNVFLQPGTSWDEKVQAVFQPFTDRCYGIGE